MENRWKEIWNKKTLERDLDLKEDEFSIYRQLKKTDGFDVNVENEMLYYEKFYRDAVKVRDKLIGEGRIQSAYEVGCGGGANLFLYKNQGIKVGGIDYSQKLADVARRVLGIDSGNIETGEALNLCEEEEWDVVLSDSVFAYFPDEEYGRHVLEKMFHKAKKFVYISEIFDKTLKEECNDSRRAALKNYDIKYKGLDKVFYSKEMFMDFAEKNHCSIWFGTVENEYYWNSRFLYNCFISKI